ncbi:MAG: hypothetical protein KAT06_05640 [Gammaproteobacteria bacterium]|nr:hypothetical protein [Gammaproteobacteria bacterium]
MSNKEKSNSLACASNSLSLHAHFQFPDIQQSEPLWKRAPARDNSGKPYSDFMMFIPGLKNFDAARLNDIVNKMGAVLKHFENDIIMADLNLKINVLWVTIQPHIGLSSEIASLIHQAVPEAKLVSQHSVTES